ncbi:glycosyltransferase family 4 protein [Subtercola boreus]|uniref:Mannosyltransferase n=1 Tax=Subtercola boreus TaxID=120213 RepID=A0A3E0WES2_9MICO|nr:glycosyltransferase family 1 protein [Subtercola boreus]RFA22622.1 mannosyltransferase [Subtercola boreus]RFA22978.1 mannosyltransferase [Subtercola boreus]RFA28729.1 mannosyltransferase [Subtercola boreus]
MATLRVVVDQILSPVPGGIGRYTEELTRAMITSAPRDCFVEGIVSAQPPAKLDELKTRLPGLQSVSKTTLRRRELSAAWQHGLFTTQSHGMVHATSLLAPLTKHDQLHQPGDQIAVTIHDVVPWTHPQTLTPHGVAWHKAMARRARRYADAVVVPTHAVAQELARYVNFGERVRVIGGAVSSSLKIPVDADARAAALGLPGSYVLAVGTLEPRKGLSSLMEALARDDAPDLPLVIAGPQGWGDLDVFAAAAAAGLPENRMHVLGFVSDEDLALVISRATVFVYPSMAEGFGLPIIEALHFGTPVIHTDVPALMEVADDASIVVPRDDAAGLPARLASAIDRVVTDDALAARLRITGLDRARAFSWRDSAEKVWQLHADL